MKCNPLLVLAAASFTQLSMANPVQVITECGTPGQVALIIDGLTQTNSPTVLASLKEQQVPALATFSQEMLVGQDNFGLLDNVKQAGLDLGYRVNIADFSNINDGELVKELKDVTTRFADIHQVKLAYVLFPYVDSSSLQKRFATIARDAGLTAVAHSLYLGDKVAQAKSVIDKDLYHHHSRAYIALLEGHATDVMTTLKYYGDRMKKNQFKAVSMATCLVGANELQEKKLNKAAHHHHHGHKGNKKTGGVPPHLIVGAAKRNGADPAHIKAQKKAELKKAKNKNGILVDPELIRGFVKKEAKEKGKKHHQHQHHKHNKEDEGGKQGQPDVQKMHAKQGKDFDLANPDVVNVKDDGNNKDGVVKQQAVDNNNAADKAKSGNGAGHLSTGATGTMIVAAVAGLLAFL